MEREWIEAMVKKYERDKKVSRVISLKSEPAVQKGNNYCSEILRTKLDVVLGSGKKTSKSVIIKCLPKSEMHRKFIVDSGIFHKEIKMYTTTIQHLETIMEECRDNDEKLWCEMIGYSCFDVIILEDLNELNYKVANRREMLDLDHTLIAIRALAKYHGMTRALIKRGYSSKVDMSGYIFTNDEMTIKTGLANQIQVLAEVMKTDWGPEWIDFSHRLSKMTENIVEKMFELGKVDDDRFNVINHGDCWTNNIMFKYDINNKPISVKLIDFQLSHYNSFAWDVTYFLFNSVKPDIRRSKYDEIIQEYYRSLESTMLVYDLTTDDIPTIGAINEEMERVKFFGFVLLCSIMPMTCADTTDAFDVELISDMSDNDNVKQAINKTIYTNSNYRKNVQKDFQDFSKTLIL